MTAALHGEGGTGITRFDMIVIGAGMSGLATTAVALRAGLHIVALDRDETIGGTWDRRYDRLRLHTIKRFSALPYLPMPVDLPRYVGKDDFARYLRAYAKTLCLPVRTGITVVNVAPDPAGWLVRSDAGEWRARSIVVATGRCAVPRMPAGLESDVPVIHSSAYRSPALFAGRNVVVIGPGNSGAEIGGDLVLGGAASVTVAARSVPRIVPVEVLGIPAQLLGMARTALPREPDAPPVIDTGFGAHVRAGRIRIAPALGTVAAGTALFSDGSTAPCDAVIAATGFAPDIARLFASPTVPGPADGVFTVGFRETIRGQIFESGREAQEVVRRARRFLDRRRRQELATPGRPTCDDMA